MIDKQANIQDYIQVIIRRRGAILTFFTVLFITVLIGTLKQRPIYEAKAVIQIEKNSPRVTSIQEVAPMGVADDYRAYKDYYETQYKLLQSPTLMRRAADALGLNKDILRNKGKRADPAKRLLKAVRIMPMKNSQLVEIIAGDTDPKMASRIANTVAEEYIKYNLQRNVNTAAAAADWLTKEIDDQRQKLTIAELALQKYREANNINVLPQVRMGGEQAAEQVKSEYAKSQAVLAGYAERYTEEHPKMAELRSQINSLRNKIQGMEDVDSGNKTMEYRTLEREADNSRRMYEILLSRLREIDVTSTMNVNNISIVDRAEPPEKPAKPSLILNMILAVMVGLVMGIGLGFFIDYLDMTIKSPTDIRDIMESRFLGGVPGIEEDTKIENAEIKNVEIDRDRITHLRPTSPVAEAYRHIRTEILSLLPRDAAPKVIVITSAEPQAGKTITSANVSISLAQNGHKVLFIDADLRKPQLHKVFNLDRQDGLGDYLMRKTDLEAIVKDAGIENLKVITSGKNVTNPAEVIGSKRMMDLIAEAKSMFDFVIFDSSPVISVTDAVILSDMADAAIQVVRSGRILAPAAIKVKEKLMNTKAKFLGVVLNDLKAEHSDYGYYHYYKYNHYYGEEDQGRNPEKKKQTFKNRIASIVKYRFKDKMVKV
ncbi:MAG: polysaccharide biosynthesis tyrosine autokinase [Candidatus Omnitrophica bacterium]|nr:polysaccharide biosynthesis tyrosine autokinase [Candidatus Omnitrophota bacterium]